LQRTQLDAMRTLCYQPGPLEKADLTDFAVALSLETPQAVATSVGA